MATAHVLIVEDERIIALDMARRLRQQGYTVAIAASGRAALDAAAAQRPAVVLMDIGLPGTLDGVETAKHLWTRFQTPVVYLTGYAGDQTLARVHTPPPCLVLRKPLREPLLLETLSQALAAPPRTSPADPRMA
jgi:CheY-like chemotaxis protein